MSRKPFNYGGQAVIEGVMMRGTQTMAVAVRDPDGNIQTHQEPLNAALYRGFIAKLPFLRGLTMLWDALGLGMRSLIFSADVAAGEEAEFSGPVAWGTIAVSLSIGVGLFFLAPAAMADGLHRLTGIESALLGNLVEGLIRLAFIIAYVWAIGRIPDIDRLYRYHGAEHKTINAYEADAPLTTEIVNRYPIEHPRCGTAFLLSVVIVSILVFALLGRPPVLLRLASRIILLPVIAGIAYEYIRFTARNMDKAVIRLIAQPNLALQRLTTRQPTYDMIECAITALESVLAAERAADEAQEETTEGTPAAETMTA
jgi:uncharacterized protein YqhQ